MSKTLNKILSWTVKNELGVNPEKTELVLFTNGNKVPNCTLVGTILRICEYAKYLGGILDRNINWNRNIDERLI